MCVCVSKINERLSRWKNVRIRSHNNRALSNFLPWRSLEFSDLAVKAVAGFTVLSPADEGGCAPTNLVNFLQLFFSHYCLH